jgi:hypothetical protein
MYYEPVKYSRVMSIHTCSEMDSCVVYSIFVVVVQTIHKTNISLITKGEKVDPEIPGSRWIPRFQGPDGSRGPRIPMDPEISWIPRSHGSRDLMDPEISWIPRSHGSRDLMDPARGKNQIPGSTGI